jgi:hypothetical protein
MESGNNVVMIFGQVYPKCIDQATKRYFLTNNWFNYDFFSFNRYQYQYENHIVNDIDLRGIADTHSRGPNTIALCGAWLESYQLARFSFVTQM